MPVKENFENIIVHDKDGKEICKITSTEVNEKSWKGYIVVATDWIDITRQIFERALMYISRFRN